MQEEFNIKILIRQNQSLSAQLQIYKSQITQLKNQLAVLTGRSETICRHFIQIASQLQRGENDSESIRLLIQRMLSVFQTGLNEQKQQSIKMELQIKQEQQQVIGICSDQKEQRIKVQSLTFKEQNSFIKKESLPLNGCILHSLYQQQKVSVQALQNQNNILKRRIVLLGNYSCSAVDKIIEDNQHLCYCGGLQVSYYNKKLQELLELKKIQVQHCQPRTATNMEADIEPNPQMDTTTSVLTEQIKILTNRLIMAQKKVNDCKLNHKVTLDLVLGSQAYQILKNQAKELMFFVSHLTGKLQNYGQYLKLIEQQRVKQIQSMMQMNRVSMQQFKPESIVDKKSGAIAVLEEMRINYNEFMDSSKVLATKIKDRFRQKLEEVDIVKDLKKKIYQLEKTQQNQVEYLPHKFTFLEKNFLRVFQSQEVAQFCKGTQLRVDIMIGDWKWFVSYFKKQLREVSQLKHQFKQKEDKISQKQDLILKDQKAFLVAIFNETKEMFDQNRANMKKIEENFNKMELKISELEFAFGDYRAKQYFRVASEQKIKKGFEERMALVAAAENDLIQVVEDRARIYELVQFQTVQFKKQEGEYLAAIQSLKLKTAMSQKINDEKEGNINRLLQEKIKYQLQVDRLKQRVVSNEVESESSLQMKKLIEKYREKISCTCGRGNEANVALNCRHIFCKSCVEKVVKSRKRCCPICSVKFSETEVHHFIYND